MTGPDRSFDEPDSFEEGSDLGVDSTEEAPGRLFGAVLMVLMLVLALGAAMVLVLADDAKWLRFGVVAALWAALAGAFAATKFRRQAQITDARVASLRDVYELELEREVSARQEYELECEVETRRRVESEVAARSARDIDALRAELRVLRENLAALLGGEVLVERVALRAESTRMRSVPGGGQQNGVPRMIEVAGERPGAPADERSARPLNAPQPARMPGRPVSPARTATRVAPEVIQAHEEATQVHLDLVNDYADHGLVEQPQPEAARPGRLRPDQGRAHADLAPPRADRAPGHPEPAVIDPPPRLTRYPPPGRPASAAPASPLGDFGPGRPSGNGGPRPSVPAEEGTHLIPAAQGPARQPRSERDDHGAAPERVQARPSGGPLDDPGRLRPASQGSHALRAAAEEPKREHASRSDFGSTRSSGRDGHPSTGQAVQDSGAHTAGRSVSELLAAYAAEETPRRRNRHQA